VGHLFSGGYAELVIEVRGDATRGDEWAYARVVVDGERVVEADVEGLE
jgi:hypothetical protein